MFCLFWSQTQCISIQFSYQSIPKISKHDLIWWWIKKPHFFCTKNFISFRLIKSHQQSFLALIKARKPECSKNEKFVAQAGDWTRVSRLLISKFTIPFSLSSPSCSEGLVFHLQSFSEPYFLTASVRAGHRKRYFHSN